MQDWKNGVGQMGSQLPRYKKDFTDDAPSSTITVPDFNVCKLDNGYLRIPPETRSRYISCPIRGPEWRALLSKFDQAWCPNVQVQPSQDTPCSSAPTAAPPAKGGDDGMALADAEGDGEALDRGTVWSDEPKTQDALQNKYGAGCHKFSLDTNLAAVLVEGPKLFVTATGDVEINTSTALLCYGAGTWVLDGKAVNYMQDRD